MNGVIVPGGHGKDALVSPENSPQAEPDDSLVNTADLLPADPNREIVIPSRQGPSMSSCGICGKRSISEALALTPPTDSQTASQPWLPPELIGELPDRLKQRQELFIRTGALHAAGIFNQEGKLLFAREDIGRHNAVDKLVGAALMEELAQYQPDHGSLEGIFHARNAMSSLKLGHARGVSMLALKLHEVELHEYPPASIKQALTGNGRASKDSVEQMVKLLLEANADLTITDDGGRMPIHWCAASNSTKCMQALCKAAAERGQIDMLNVVDAQGMAHPTPESSLSAAYVSDAMLRALPESGYTTAAYALRPAPATEVFEDGDEITLEVQNIGKIHLRVEDPLKREWPRGIDQETAERMQGSNSGNP